MLHIYAIQIQNFEGIRFLVSLVHKKINIRFTCCTCTMSISKVLIFVGKKLHMKSAKLNTLSTCLVIVILALQYFLCIHEFFIMLYVVSTVLLLCTCSM